MAEKLEETELTNEDYNRIYDLAHNHWVNHPYRPSRDLVCESYVDAVIMYFNSKGYVLKDGKIYKRT